MIIVLYLRIVIQDLEACDNQLPLSHAYNYLVQNKAQFIAAHRNSFVKYWKNIVFLK